MIKIVPVWLRCVSKIIVDTQTGCWIWKGATGTGGYSKIGKGNHKTTSTHIITFTKYNGKVPEGLEIDHLCKNVQCVNPSHLEAVTQLENKRRGKKAQQTHCINGHEFTVENTQIRSNGTRKCKTCIKERWKKYYSERRYK